MSYYRKVSSSEDDIFLFSWERNQGASRLVLPRSNSTHSISNEEEEGGGNSKKRVSFPLPLPLPPSPHLNNNFRKHGSWSKVDDPFYAAYMKCTDMSRSEEKKTTVVNRGKKIGKGFSCMSTSMWNDVMHDAMVRSPRLPKSHLSHWI